MKYLVVQTVHLLPAAILFNEALTHKSVAGAQKVLSAGFCNAQGEVWGRSDSLNIAGHPSDTGYVKMALTLSLNPKDGQ